MTSLQETKCAEDAAEHGPAWRGLLACALSGVIALAWSAFALGVGHANWHVPFHYSNPYYFVSGTDNIGALMGIRTIQQFGRFFSSPLLGAPLGTDFRDYPMHDALHVGAVWLISRFTPDFGMTVNLYYVASFPLAAMIGCWVAIKLGLQRLSSVAIGVLFACLPYHYLRGQGHIYLSMYYHVPLGVLLIARAWMGLGLLLAEGRGWSARRTVLMGILSVIVASGGVYYALFTAGLVGTAGILHASGRRWRSFFDAGLVSALIVATLALILLPSVLYRMSAGPNPAAVARIPGQAEYYGLKIVQLVLPTLGHRVPMLASLAEYYERSTTAFNENASSAIGLIGVFGLMAMTGWLLGWRPRVAHPPLLAALSRANLVAIGFATTGGVSMLVAITISPVLRSCNRISVFIAFFAFVAAFGVIETWQRPLDRWGKNTYPLLVGALVLVGLLDLTSPMYRPDYALSLKDWQRDADFVAAIERELPEGAAVFQLPYVPFPEGGSYDQFRGYLHSDKLKWSAGAIRGRECDALQQGIAGKAGSPEFRPALAKAGFSGVWLDRGHWPDEQVVNWMRQNIDPQPVASSDGRFLFFQIR